ncbi:MAG: glycosyltransferase [Parcubacteria group bacterium]|nr:glycosyltransferase [Parcubacteria group bacterium]
MNTARAFKQGKDIEITLVVPWRLNPIKQDPFLYYGVDAVFNIKRLPVLDLIPIPFFKPLWFWIESVTFSVSAIARAVFEKDAVFYTRDFLVAFLFALFHKPIFYELHTLPQKSSFLHNFVLRKSMGLVVISNGIKKDLMRFGVSEDKILCAPDAVDLRRFDIVISKEAARKTLNLPLDKKIILYAGHLYKWKGVNTLIEAAKKLDADMLVYLVGGTAEEVSKYKIQNIKYKNIIFVGHRQHQEIPLWLRAADVLVLPTSGKEKIGREYTSPMKLFEYMASGTPIIASDTPAVREILHETTAIFFDADNPNDLAKKTVFGLSDCAALKTFSKKARETVVEYSWSNRAANIIHFMKNILHNNGTVLRQTSGNTYKELGEILVFTKTDFWRTLIIGEAIALLSIPVFQNIKVFDILARYNHGLSFFVIGLWLFLLPFMTVAGLYGAYLLGMRWRSSIFQIGKYGLIGLLNTFLFAGITNLFIWFTDIARGWQVIFFTIISSIITITHSFFWNKFWTFRAHNTDNGRAEYIKFFTITSATSLLNIFLLHIIVNVIGAPNGIDPKIWVNIALAIEIPIAFFGNFFGYKIFVFTHHGRDAI